MTMHVFTDDRLFFPQCITKTISTGQHILAEISRHSPAPAVEREIASDCWHRLLWGRSMPRITSNRIRRANKLWQILHILSHTWSSHVQCTISPYDPRLPGYWRNSYPRNVIEPAFDVNGCSESLKHFLAQDKLQLASVAQYRKW